jgi:hypothetical protein
MDLETSYGIATHGPARSRADSLLVLRIAAELVDRAREHDATQQTCPADRRIEAFLNEHFADLGLSEPLRLPSSPITLHRYGIARALSLPEGENSYRNPILSSYRVRNGVLHNPLNDRRTTQGTFHVTEGGLPIPGDKKAVPRHVFVNLLRHAVDPPAEFAVVPFTANRPEPLRAFVSLLLRPVVRPEVPGVCSRASMEVRFFAPGGLASNLDFVESIFGNAGDPSSCRNDAGLDVEHWTGHTGCVILAPHLTSLTKRELGLSRWEEATERQRRDGMCWHEPGERYNDGSAFKVTCRSHAGVIVTLIADNYFGYCKKEVKTQISYAANLFGGAEEEHSGGALAFPSYSLGFEFDARNYSRTTRTVEDLARNDPATFDLQPEGHAFDTNFPDLVYVPPDAKASVTSLKVSWRQEGHEVSIPLKPGRTYMTPSGYKVRLEKHPGAASWRLVGTVAEGTHCHKPCTVSGGGKSEISKGLRDYMIYGPVFVANWEADIELVQQIMDREYSNRWRPGLAPDYSARPSRPLLSPLRSLGSVIKLLTPSEDYTDEYRAWLGSLPNYIFPIVFIIKRFVPHAALGRWRDVFSVDSVNGFPGHELKAYGRKLVGTYLRVGFGEQGWRTFKVRQDFIAADKVQVGDDITASVVVPSRMLRHLPAGTSTSAVKFTENCEARLFQRPDDAIHRGLDHQTEADLARPDNFLSNFEPLTSVQAREIVERVTEFEEFTPPMQQVLHEAAEAQTGYVVCSANPRLVDGKPSKNPRYLQTRPDLLDARPKYVAERGMRLARGLKASEALHVPVGAILIGRRSNPPDPKAGIRPLAVYGPIHYQDLPELFMDFICSLTGKSPSTTGAGSEGAMTKGPFNALRPTHDLNAALVSYMLTGLGGFSTSAGYVGPKMKVDHDVSLLIPEVWSRMDARERDPTFLIDQGHLEPLRDFDHEGKAVLASRLGYRVTSKFVRTFFGRVFDYPARVFDEAFLRPETQDMDAFVDGVNNITEAQQRVARQYFDDSSIEDACPPLKALLTIMAEGSWDGMDAHDPRLRAMFTRESLLGSTWYRDRLAAQQAAEVRLWRRHLDYLDRSLSGDGHVPPGLEDELLRRRKLASAELERVRSAGRVEQLVGSLGLDPALLGKG